MTKKPTDPQSLEPQAEETSSQTSMADDAAELVRQGHEEAAREAQADQMRAESEPPADLPRIERQSDDGEVFFVALMTEEGFTAKFVEAFNMAPMLHPALVTVAIDNGDPLRPHAANVTAKKLYRLCRGSSFRWLQDLIRHDESGIGKAVEWAAVIYFGASTVKGINMALPHIMGAAPSEEPEGEQAHG